MPAGMTYCIGILRTAKSMAGMAIHFPQLGSCGVEVFSELSLGRSGVVGWELAAPGKSVASRLWMMRSVAQGMAHVGVVLTSTGH